MRPEAQQRLLGAFCIAAGLTALGVGGAALYIGGGIVLAVGLLLAVVI